MSGSLQYRDGGSKMPDTLSQFHSILVSVYPMNGLSNAEVGNKRSAGSVGHRQLAYLSGSIRELGIGIDMSQESHPPDAGSGCLFWPAYVNAIRNDCDTVVFEMAWQSAIREHAALSRLLSESSLSTGVAILSLHVVMAPSSRIPF